MKRFRRRTIIVLALASLMILGIASTAVAFTAYIHQDAGQTSYSYAGWYIYDDPVIHVRDPNTLGTSLDLHTSEIATYTPSIDLGGVGTATAPSAVGVAMATESAMLFLNNSHIYSFGSNQFQGPQCVYASTAYVSLMDCLVYGDSLAAHGLLVEKGGSINAERTTIITNKNGPSGSAVAGAFDTSGVITLHACEIHSWGTDDAAAYYATGSTSVTDTKAYAHESEGAWIDGGGDMKLDWSPVDKTYALAMYNSSLYAYKNFGVSFAKGPLSDVADDTDAGFAMAGGYLESAKASFYAPNSKALILLDGMSNYSYDGTLLTTLWTGQGPGGGEPTKDSQTQPGSRESTADLFATGCQLKGDVITDVDEYTEKDSTVNMHLSGWTDYAGALNKADRGVVNLYMAKEADWHVTADSYLGVVDVPTVDTNHNPADGMRTWLSFSPDLSKVFSNGHTIYYNSFADPSIEVKTYPLPGGGWLVPEVDLSAAALWNW